MLCVLWDNFLGTEIFGCDSTSHVQILTDIYMDCCPNNIWSVSRSSKTHEPVWPNKWKPTSQLLCVEHKKIAADPIVTARNSQALLFVVVVFNPPICFSIFETLNLMVLAQTIYNQFRTLCATMQTSHFSSRLAIYCVLQSNTSG